MVSTTFTITKENTLPTIQDPTAISAKTYVESVMVPAVSSLSPGPCTELVECTVDAVSTKASPFTTAGGPLSDVTLNKRSNRKYWFSDYNFLPEEQLLYLDEAPDDSAKHDPSPVRSNKIRENSRAHILFQRYSAPITCKSGEHADNNDEISDLHGGSVLDGVGEVKGLAAWKTFPSFAGTPYRDGSDENLKTNCNGQLRCFALR